jgi:hypothetical protein
VQYLNKWGNKESEFKQLFQIVFDHNSGHNATISGSFTIQIDFNTLEFVKKERAYMTSLKEVLAKADKLHHEEKVVQDLEEKVAKKKASEHTLKEARKKRDDLFNEYQHVKSTLIRENIKNLTKAYCDMVYHS